MPAFELAGEGAGEKLGGENPNALDVAVNAAADDAGFAWSPL